MYDKMAKIKLIVEGGKASTTPAMAQTLGPMKIDMGEMLGKINEKTAEFKGMKVPVEINVDEKDKSYDMIVMTPPASELIKKELGINLGSGVPDKKKVGNISIEQLLKVAKMKREGMFVNNLMSAVKAIAGSCNSMGILIEGNDSATFNGLLAEGKYDNEINAENTELDPEKAAELKKQLEDVQEELDRQFAKKEQKKLEMKAEDEKAVETKEEEVAEVETKEEGEVKEGEEEKDKDKKPEEEGKK
tara:strand:+ start:5716 stop:6453 length:738 start_codon:yes stop_codon:yes gene_type:complete